MNKLIFGTGLGFFILEVLFGIFYGISKMNLSNETISTIFVFGGLIFINLIFGILMIVGATRE